MSVEAGDGRRCVTRASESLALERCLVVNDVRGLAPRGVGTAALMVPGVAPGQADHAPTCHRTPRMAPFHRHSVGFPSCGRDSGQPRSVHLSGGARDRVKPSPHPRPSEAPTRRRAHPRRTERGGDHPMPLPLSSFADDGDSPPLLDRKSVV